MRFGIPGLLLLALFARAPAASAAESYDNCTGYITSLPAVITTQGTWCLKQDLSTSISSGVAISINTNNVTLDCNDFKIGGLGAGIGTETLGIESMERSNVTIRRCNVRGFWMGIMLEYNAGGDGAPPSGNIVENNRVDASTRIGIGVQSDASIVRNNIITNTGGNRGGDNPIGITTNFGVDVIGNLIDGVSPDSASTLQTYGISAWKNSGGSISGNRIRGVIANGIANGILATFDSTVAISDNTIFLPSPVSNAILCIGEGSIATGNLMLGPGTGMTGCSDGGNTTP